MTRVRSKLAALVVSLLLGIPTIGAAQEAWSTHPLTDAATGETFTVAAYQGTPVLVETMATWCGNCRRQLANLRAASEMLAADGLDVIYVVISVERGLPDDALAAYAERQAFPFRFAVADDALLGLLADRFGRGALNPPSTPHVIVAADGTVSELRTGFSSPEELVTWLTAAAP